MALLDPQLAEWRMRACRLCAIDVNRQNNTGLSPVVPASPPPEWHFACEPVPRPADVPCVESWAVARSAERCRAPRHPRLDVDGEPLNLNQEHPFNEAEDIVYYVVTAESEVFVLARNIVELAVAIDELPALVATWNTSLAAPLGVADDEAGGEADGDGRQWFSFMRRPLHDHTVDEVRRGMEHDILANTHKVTLLRAVVLTPLIPALERAGPGK
ncbi:hypothetical protein ColLi_09066 [Colletotrichum liriopes]|uniref:Uncharacterized protein n=1 Tax=Colletotrichum liriopes TaxID=708192 RepID=A0AA37GU94_9PEZI|nr:hypothetical protein ColLi_09066 [Colletotrichum liriopes]